MNRGGHREYGDFFKHVCVLCASVANLFRSYRGTENVTIYDLESLVTGSFLAYGFSSKNDRNR
jgi:hypothetical protein